MSKLKLNITMSIDSFVAGPDRVAGASASGSAARSSTADSIRSRRSAEATARKAARSGEHAFRKEHPRAPARSSWGRRCSRRRPGTVGRVVEGGWGQSALPPCRLHPPPPSAPASGDARRNDIRRYRRNRVGARNRHARQLRRRRCFSAAGHPSRENTSQRVSSTRSFVSIVPILLWRRRPAVRGNLGDAKPAQIESVEAPGVTTSDTRAAGPQLKARAPAQSACIPPSFARRGHQQPTR